EDEHALAEAIIRLLQNPQLRAEMGAQGRLHAEQFSWTRVAVQVVEYYNELYTQRLIELEREPDRGERRYRELTSRVSTWFDPR
ncbi:MAG: hypothetical protein HY326_03815, partial [Chloroflexi bacterium]|nr:hypothetical protein [Chloroflexota bacterium]